MANYAKEFKPTVSYYKILETVLFLNKQHYYPLPGGIRKILQGVVDDETKNFVDCPTFGTLISFPSKKVCRYVMMLVRYNYLEKIYDRSTNELYLKTTDFGEISLAKFNQKHKKDFSKKCINKKPTIVKID